MPNDFLSNLSSRALQNAEVNSPSSGLKPRLASRFENLDTPIVPAADQALDTEAFIDVEAGANTGLRNSTPGQDQTQVVYKRSVPNEGSRLGVLTAPERRSDKSEYVFEIAASPIMSNSLKPFPAADHPEASPIRSMSPYAEQTELPSSSEKNKNLLQPSISPVSAMVSPGAEPIKTIETHTHIMETQTPLRDSKQAMLEAALPAILPPSQTKVVPERIEVTRMEQHSRAAANGSQIVPSVELPAFKPQCTTPEAQEQPPTIHVTIGRIEVKAASPAASPKRRTASSSTMSLDEYLRRRQGSER